MSGGYRYDRVLLKLSGEALAGDVGYGIDPKVVDDLADQIAEVVHDGVQLAVVVGGGNIFRGLAGSAEGMDRAQADYIGMLATVMNALALQDAFERHGIFSRVQSAITMQEVSEPYIRRRAIRHMEKGRVVILAAGTGNPYFTTDTTAALRACELDVDVLMKATKVDGVYDSDPKENPDAKRFDRLSYMDVLSRGLNVMDSTATSLCMDNHVPMIVFDLDREGQHFARFEGRKRRNHGRIGRGERARRWPGARVRSRVKGTATMVNDILTQAEERMKKAVSSLHDNFGSVRTGRANAMLLDRIKVDYYGVPTPVNQMAGIKSPDAHMLVIEPWDKGVLRAIEHAILESDLGVTPSNDGSVIRLPFPALTEERRRELVKQCKTYAEEARVAVRKARQEANSAIERTVKEESLPEDDERRGQAEVQKLTDKYIAEVDAVFKKKEAEVMEI